MKIIKNENNKKIVIILVVIILLDVALLYTSANKADLIENNSTYDYTDKIDNEESDITTQLKKSTDGIKIEDYVDKLTCNPSSFLSIVKEKQYVSYATNTLNNKNIQFIIQTSNGESGICTYEVKGNNNTQVEQNTTDICEKVKSKKYIDYNDFLELSKDMGNGNKDDYYAIKAAHDCANLYKKEVKVTKNTFNIYLYEKNSEDNRIRVQTNTNLGNSTIYIHDENIIVNNKRKYSDYIYDIENGVVKLETPILMKNEVKKGNIFAIPEDIKNQLKELAVNKDKKLKGYLVRIEEANPTNKVFIRWQKEDQAVPINDSFIVNGNGTINNDIMWDYLNKNIKVEARAILSDQLVFKNAKFITIASEESIESGYVKRGINISRSNIKITNIKHSILDKNKKTKEYLGYEYNGFFNFNDVAYVTFENSEVQATSKPDPNKEGKYHSSYDIKMNHVANIELNTIKQTNDIKKASLWGVTGTHHVKDITYNNCFLNRIDTHMGVYNLTINNSTIGVKGLTQIGFGDLILNNVKLVNANHFILLRSDYGSTWKGKVIVKGNNEITPRYKDEAVLLVKQVLKNPNHNYGYDLYLPSVEFEKSSTITISGSKNEFAVFGTKRMGKFLTQDDLNKYVNTYNKKHKNEGIKADFSLNASGYKGKIKNAKKVKLYVID